MKSFVNSTALIAFLFCLLGGLVVIRSTGFSFAEKDAIWTGIGLYFIGKSIFVGVMIFLTARGTDIAR